VIRLTCIPLLLFSASLHGQQAAPPYVYTEPYYTQAAEQWQNYGLSPEEINYYQPPEQNYYEHPYYQPAENNFSNTPNPNLNYDGFTYDDLQPEQSYYDQPYNQPMENNFAIENRNDPNLAPTYYDEPGSNHSQPPTEIGPTEEPFLPQDTPPDSAPPKAQDPMENKLEAETKHVENIVETQADEETSNPTVTDLEETIEASSETPEEQSETASEATEPTPTQPTDPAVSWGNIGTASSTVGGVGGVGVLYLVAKKMTGGAKSIGKGTLKALRKDQFQQNMLSMGAGSLAYRATGNQGLSNAAAMAARDPNSFAEQIDYQADNGHKIINDHLFRMQGEGYSFPQHRKPKIRRRH
jgi:hypothetical protein